MTNTSARLLVWLPRILGIGVALFVALFALDAFGDGAVSIAMHILPSLLILAVVAIGWKHPWVAAAAFIALAVYYAASVRRMDWILVVATPLLIVGLLFVVSGMLYKRPMSSAQGNM